MAEILEKMSELQALPEDQHLFCPRLGGDGSVYFEEDLAGYSDDADDYEREERRSKIKEAEDRKWTALKALEILAFDGEDAAPHKEWLLKRFNAVMESCDVCVRVFYQSKAAWRLQLMDAYDEENIGTFMQLVDNECINRIIKGLDGAKATLEAVQPNARVMRLLPTVCTYAIFEALSCDAFIRNETLLHSHFDAPFAMVQTKKRLKLQTYLPAMTRFLFSRNPQRRDWAIKSWISFKRDPLKSEFEWAVRDHLVDCMMKVQMTNLDLTYLPLFWAGANIVIQRMSKEMITEHLRSLEGDFYRLMLDHMSLNSEAFTDLLSTMKLLVEKAPVDFWDGMNAITPSIANVVEQVFNAPSLKRVLSTATDSEDDLRILHSMMNWTTPFLESIKVSNLGPAIRPFANALLAHFQSDRYSQTSRAFCLKEGMKVLVYAFKRMGEYRIPSEFVGQPTVNGMLEILSTHIKMLTTNLKLFNLTKDRNAEELQLALQSIQYAFQLEAKSLLVERHLIEKKQPSPTETPSSSPIWRTVLGAIDSANLDLAMHLLIAGRTLIGLEPLQMKAGVDYVPPEVRHFNDRFKVLSKSITDVVDRLSDFDPSQLQALFARPTAASAIVSLLFSSTEDTRSSVIELLKVISNQEERRDALQHILKAYYKNTLTGISDSTRQVKNKKAFAPAPSMIKTCSDIIDVMCNSQDGILRSRGLETGESGVTMNFWRNLWDMLTMIFGTTEAWSNLGFYDKNMMMDFCRDVMQFADQLFDQYGIFATALKGSNLDMDDGTSQSDFLKELLAAPTESMDNLARWLRLRDEFLSSKSVTLISKLLIRLHDVSVELPADALDYMERVLSGDVRAKLSTTQQAELQRALEIHLGHSLIKEEAPSKPKQASLTQWMSTGAAGKDRASPSDAKSKLIANLTSGASAFQEKRERMKAAEAAKAAQAKARDDQKVAQQDEFRRKRQLEKQKREQEKAAAIAKAKQARGGVTAEAGSGLEGLGVLGKEQAAKGEGLMHSSDESEDSEGDIDEDLFGIKKTKPMVAGPRTNIINEVKIQMPFKKKRVARSITDMRARLAPDLSALHKMILGWDYFHDGDFPPKSRPDIYSKVLSTFRSPHDYQTTFEPLLTLEAWQGFVKAREENTAKAYEVRITSRASVDAFQEVGSTMTHVENKDIYVSEGDIILLSKTKTPSADETTCLARVFKVKRKQQHIEVSYRVIPGNPLSSSLNPKGTVFGTKIQSITPLEREYGALKGLQYYDLCDEIIRAKPSPLLSYSEKQIDPLIQTYRVNKAQAKAIKSAIDNDAFTLIQGPPGSGKTKTITAIVGALLSETLRNRGTTITVPGQKRSDGPTKKLLVCAPSNAAVDELVMRFKDGIKTLNGEERKVNIVRLGRSDAINVNVQDVTLEELVSKKMGVSTSDSKDAAATRKLFEEHKSVSDQVRQIREQLDAGQLKGEAASKLQDEFNQLRRQKALLGTKIDNAKDDERLASRNADLNRRRAQEAVLNDAHVICSTLSGSGHEMFQGLSIEFETVIVDEAAQCVEMSALIPLKYGCAKCILVGDPKQLPPTVFSKEAARFQYEQSLFVRMQKNHPNDVHLLDTQYRMHPEISLFPSQTFYDGRLLDGGDMAGLRQQPWHKSMILGPYRFFDVRGQHQAAPKGHSLINLAEIEIAMKLYKRVTSDYPDFNFRGKVGIITPYKSQLRELKSRFMTTYGAGIIEDIEFNTTDAFQGRESGIIIFSCVRASPSGGVGFLQDIRRMNVGLTRAKSSLWVLGNSQSLMRGEYWRKLVEDAQARERYTTGDLNKILSQHSSKFPAPKEGYVQPHRPDPEQSSEPVKKEAEPEIKQEIKTEPGLVHHPKRKAEDFDVVKEEKGQSSDVEMDDLPSETASNHLNGGSAYSSPAAYSSNRATPDIDGGNGASGSETAAVPGIGGGSGAAKPKIRIKPREPVAPFIKKKKIKKG